MRRIVNTLRSKLASTRSRAGFTLTETLAAIAILLCVTAVVAAGVPAAQKAYVGTVDTANAQVLLSTSATRLRSELSVADPATVKNKNATTDASTGETTYVTFESLETGYDTSLKYNDQLGLFVEQTSSDGTTAQTRLVPEKAAAGANAGLRTIADSITYDEATGVFTVTNLKVMRADGTPLERAHVDTLDIRALAG